MVIEEFWSPSNTPTPSDGDQNSSISQEGKRGWILFNFQNHNTCLHPFQYHSTMGVMSKGNQSFLITKKGGHI
jgi:hypothetical protein